MSFLVVFSFFEKTTYCRARRLSVRPSCRPSVRLSVCTSVEIISFRGNSLSNWPIELKIGLNVREGVVHVRKAWVFEIRIASCNFFCNLCCNSCKLRKILPYFPDNYRSCFNLYFNLWPSLLFTVNSKCEYTIHERYDFYTQ